jgi:epoxyqueuosine reductase QueG
MKKELELLKQKILEAIPSCCDVGFLGINNCSEDERTHVHGFLPQTNTIIVLAHHVKTSLEWAWFPLESERNNVTCGADLHAKNVISQIEHLLLNNGYSSRIVDYPGKSGIRMKEFAGKTNLGSIGDNYLFLHKKWGPWAHLRILLTNAEIADSQNKNPEVCIHCGKCIAACPAKAIEKNSFDGILCDKYQTSINNDIKDVYYWKCEICARICQIGQSPLPIKIIQDDNEEGHKYS